jgi:hypothetical protein
MIWILISVACGVGSKEGPFNEYHASSDESDESDESSEGEA